jgi:hypothetical protein
MNEESAVRESVYVCEPLLITLKSGEHPVHSLTNLFLITPLTLTVVVAIDHVRSNASGLDTSHDTYPTVELHSVVTTSLVVVVVVNPNHYNGLVVVVNSSHYHHCNCISYSDHSTKLRSCVTSITNTDINTTTGFVIVIRLDLTTSVAIDQVVSFISCLIISFIASRPRSW